MQFVINKLRSCGQAAKIDGGWVGALFIIFIVVINIVIIIVIIIMVIVIIAIVIIIVTRLRQAFGWLVFPRG